MPSAVAEAKAAAMDNAVDVWRLDTASRLHAQKIRAETWRQAGKAENPQDSRDNRLYGGECSKAGEEVSKTFWVGSIPNRPCQMYGSTGSTKSRRAFPVRCAKAAGRRIIIKIRRKTPAFRHGDISSSTVGHTGSHARGDYVRPACGRRSVNRESPAFRRGECQFG